MGSFEWKMCRGCGFSIEPHYFVGQAPDFCARCESTLMRLAQKWRSMGLDDRTLTHTTFCQNYAAKYHHGAPGHMDYMTIATLASMLDDPGRVL